MAKYQIEFTDEIWQRIIIEANSEDEAREIFASGEFDWTDVQTFGGEIQDSVEITEVDNA